MLNDFSKDLGTWNLQILSLVTIKFDLVATVQINEIYRHTHTNTFLK